MQVCMVLLQSEKKGKRKRTVCLVPASFFSIGQNKEGKGKLNINILLNKGIYGRVDVCTYHNEKQFIYDYQV